MSAHPQRFADWTLDDDGIRIVLRHPPGWLRQQSTLMARMTVVFLPIVGFWAFSSGHLWLIGLAIALVLLDVVSLMGERERRFTFDVRRQLLLVDAENGGAFVSDIRLVPRTEFISVEHGDRHFLGLRAADRLLWESSDLSAVRALAAVLSERLGVPTTTS
jgi:hypothetical protein